MDILFVSNGHGEDVIAANLIDACLELDSSVDVSACALVGSGSSFKKRGVKVWFENPVFPSGGFIRSFGMLLKDIFAGLIGHLVFQARSIRKCSQNTDYVVVCGDVFCLFMAMFSKKPLFFLPTAKSEKFMSHSFVERYLIKRVAKLSFPRDEETTRVFQRDNLPSLFLVLNILHLSTREHLLIP